MDTLRSAMVKLQLEARGISDPRVLEAFATVPRELFVPAALHAAAYSDGPLPIGAGQTISQPYVTALAAEAMCLRGGERVLEVGTGSGYGAAILAQLSAQVYTVERHPRLVESAQRNLVSAGVAHVRLFCGDGSVGLPELAPFDAIVVTACAPTAPSSLLAQLRIGGRLVIPVAYADAQYLSRIARSDETQFVEQRPCEVSFVPLIGKEAWPS